ncbi:hypothetical protein IT418_04075, partial [bacterium]|nr:hypothetical protein [bacterium]
QNAPHVYRYINKNVRTENDDIDWDRITSSLDRSFCKRWVRYRQKSTRVYENQSEVDIILSKYKDRLYTFIAYATEEDKKMQSRMLISLVRLSQKGNVCAEQEVVKWITYITDDWTDRYPQMYRWRGYADEVDGHIKGCVRRYRYTGSFLGYLFKTLEYSVRGKPPLVSLNDNIFGDKTREEYAKVEEDWQIYK